MRKLEFVFEFLIQWVDDNCKSQDAVDCDEEVSALLNPCVLDRADDGIIETVSVGQKSKYRNRDVQHEYN